MGFFSAEEAEQIMNGTQEKKFLNARRELEREYTESFANDFFYTYCDLPLSMILKHSRDIFSETYFGYDFYRKILQGRVYDTRIYGQEASKVNDYLIAARKSNLPKHQIEKYEELLEFLTESTNAYQNTTRALVLAAECVGGDHFITTVCDEIYELENENCGDDSLGQYTDMMDRIIESIYSVKSLYCKIPLAILVTLHYPKYIPYLREEIRRIMDVSPNQTDLSDVKRLQYVIRRMLSDFIILDQLKQVGYEDLLYSVLKLSGERDVAESICAHIAETKMREISDSLGETVIDGMPTPNDIEKFMENAEENPELITCRYDNLKRKLSLYEAAMDLVADYTQLKTSTDKLQWENVDDMINALESEIAFYEWEDDGTPNAIVRQHIMTSKDREAEETKRKAEKPTLLKSLRDKNQKADDSVETESELCEEIKRDIKTLGSFPSVDSYSDNEDLMKKLKAIRERMKGYESEIQENPEYARAKKLYEDLCDEMVAMDPQYESVDDVVERQMLLYLEEDSSDETEEPESSSGDKKKKSPLKRREKPKKPNTDLATKIQNKALDRAAKDEERMAKTGEKVQKLKNAGNAVSQTPKRVGDDISNFVKNFDKWDDNRRKKFILKPGFRHKIFKKFRKALELGVVAHMKLAWVPMLALLNHCSKLKDQRIRNELALELENEIKICEAKIDDANAEGDKKKKYELMRIKDKLEAEKTRVRINSKYV